MSAGLSARRIAGFPVKTAVDAMETRRPRERGSSIALALEHGELAGSAWTLPFG
jgi:hypothetical protein